MKNLYFALFCLLFAVSGWAQALPGVTVNTAASTGNTVTVTTAAPHGMIVGQGFCLSATALCGVAVAPTASSTVTFSTPGGLTCASSCGTITPAKQIITLASSQTSPTSWSIQVAFWLTTAQGVPSAATTQYTGATAAEKSAISAGNFVEQVRTFSWTTADSFTTIKQVMQNAYTSAQATLSQSIQPGQFFGVFYNGAWSQ